jgi:integrase
VRAGVSKTGAARWVEPPPAIFAAVSELVARDDRVPARPVFAGFGSDRFRTALGRARTAAGVPTFSPHDLRHRRVSLLHAQGSHGRASASASDTATSSRRRGRTRTSSSTRPSSTI